MMLKQLLCFGMTVLALSLAAVPPRQISVGTSSAVTIDKDSRIVVAPDASSATRYAANELQRMLGVVLGAELPIVNAPGQGAELIVGINPWSRAAGIDDAKLCRDAFIIKNVAIKSISSAKMIPKPISKKSSMAVLGAFSANADRSSASTTFWNGLPVYGCFFRAKSAR